MSMTLSASNSDSDSNSDSNSDCNSCSHRNSNSKPDYFRSDLYLNGIAVKTTYTTAKIGEAGQNIFTTFINIPIGFFKNDTDLTVIVRRLIPGSQA